MPDWPALYDRWCTADSGTERWDALDAARRAVAEKAPGRWDWLRDALADPHRRYFVAWVFERQPVPRALLVPMLRAALDEDASGCRGFVYPLVTSFGEGEVRERLGALNPPPRPLSKVTYWLRHPRPRF